MENEGHVRLAWGKLPIWQFLRGLGALGFMLGTAPNNCNMVIYSP